MKTFQPELPTHSHPSPNVHDGRTEACHHPSPPRHFAHATSQMCDTLGQSETFGDTTAPDTHLSPFETFDATPETYEECVESVTFVDEQDRNPNDDPHLKQSRVAKATGPRQPCSLLVRPNRAYYVSKVRHLTTFQIAISSACPDTNAPRDPSPHRSPAPISSRRDTHGNNQASEDAPSRRALGARQTMERRPAGSIARPASREDRLQGLRNTNQDTPDSIRLCVLDST